MIPRFDTLDALLEYAFKEYPDKPAFTCTGHTLSFRQIEKLSRRFANYLSNHTSLQPGDRIAIQLPNVLQYPVVMYGALLAGLIVVNVNPLYTPRELKHQLKDSGAKALVVLVNVAANVASIIQQTDITTVITTSFADLHPAPKRWLINYVVKNVKKLVPEFEFKNSISLRRALFMGRKSASAHKCNTEDVAVLQYTGGTTGVAKGAMLSHKNLCSNSWQMIKHMPEVFVRGEEVWIACLPLYHIYAFNLHGFSSLCMGVHNILIPNPRDLDSLVKALLPHRMTVFIGINTLLNALARFAPFKQVDFSSLKITTAGGMALTEDVAKLWTATTGSSISEGYGLTETSPVVSGNPVDAIQLGTIGQPLPETEVKTVDDMGNDLALGEVGELCVRGPQVMKGYWQRPDETEKVLSSDGWLRTGDMAIIQKDGYLRIVDRKKDMILVSGFNVYPNEVEDVICTHPDIIEAAAVGAPDSESGEVVKLFVVTENDTLTEDEVYDYCKERLTGYKRPKIIEFRDSLPKSNVGKILRKELRDTPENSAAQVSAL